MFMLKSIVILTALLLLLILSDSIVRSDKILFTSCARMDDWGGLGAKIAQAACIGSCKFQNCGTGHCEHRGGRPVCVCSRCAGGGGTWPSIPGKKWEGRRFKFDLNLLVYETHKRTRIHQIDESPPTPKWYFFCSHNLYIFE